MGADLIAQGLPWPVLSEAPGASGRDAGWFLQGASLRISAGIPAEVVASLVGTSSLPLDPGWT